MKFNTCLCKKLLQRGFRQLDVFLLFFFALTVYQNGYTQFVIFMDPLSVTASRLDHPFVSETRELTVITSEQLSRIPAESVADVLQYIGVADVQRRGIDGVQADFALRGGSFEQVIVLVDGIRVNNPQTGHHHGNIPVSLSDIERIEVLSGHGSSLYGSNGVGGVIHIITRNPAQTRTRLQIRGGSFGTAAAYASQSFSLLGMGHQVSYERNQSDGYRRDTDYQVNTFSYHFKTGGKRLNVNGRAGYQSKDFGANGFYADYPSRENIRSMQGYIRTEWQPYSKIFIQSSISANRHNDHFILDMERPEWYQNDHTTDVYSADVQVNINSSSQWKTAAGFEMVQSELTSSVLGNHEQRTGSLYGETVYQISERSLLNGGVRLDHQPGQGLQVNPSLGMRYAIKSKLFWRLSGGRVFRIPNFTELYYQSPANTGNPDLKPESGWTWETGIIWQDDVLSATFTLFNRIESNHIDWIREGQDEAWRVMNLSELDLWGVSASANWRMNNNTSLEIVYSGLSHNYGEEEAMMKKYGDFALKQKIQFSAETVWAGNLRHSLVFRLIQRRRTKSVLLFDAKWNYPFKKWTFFTEWKNIFNQKYEEISGVLMPGSHVITGFSRDIEW